jgi:thymidylate synthase
MNNIDRKYQQLLSDIIEFGVEKKDRTGTGTLSEFGHQIRHKMSEGFPILTTKKMAWKQIVSELLWFLTGQTNIAFLHKHNNHIWDGDYEKSGRDDGDLGPIYGHQWRNWGGWKEVKFTGEKDENGYLKPSYIKHNGIDQIADLVRNLKENPDSRRLMVSAWNVGQLDKMVLPPCHYGFQVWTRELTYSERYKIWFNNNYETGMEYYEGNVPDFDNSYYEPTPTRAISLMWNQRSVDTFLGLPFNIASYGLLLHILANEVNMIPDELIGNLGDTHLYSNHIEQAKEQIGRTSFNLPKLKTDVKIDGICCATPDDFVLENYQYHPTIKAPLSN